MYRRRNIYLFLLILVIGLGLASRMDFVPAWIFPYLGDAFYALMIYIGTGFIFPKMKAIHVFLLATSICYLIEISQLYQAPWINQIRNTRLGGLILGYHFLWSDLASYAVGAGIGFSGEYIWQRLNKSNYL